MDKAEYCTKVGNLLMDKEAYAPSTVSEFKKLVNSINNTIGKLRKAGALTRKEALAAKASDTAMARFYGLPKVHKQGVPLRPIVSLRGTPTFGLSKWLYQRLCFLTKDSEWTVKSAEEFLTRIKHLEVEADEVMVSFDVISLFTSIPPALAINTIDGFLREKYDETDQQLKRAHITELLELCLKTFFTFNGQVYEQKKGTPMGSPLSGLIAEAVLQRLEQHVFSSYPPKFWARYVDDTFVVIKRSEVKAFKALLNSIFPDIQFTMEEEVNNQLPFLDVQITRLTDGKIRTTVYRRATNTRRILHFRSNHPVGHKRSCVRTLFQRVQTHCSDDSGRKEEINYLQALFKANGYPKSFIRNCLKKPHFERSSGEKPKFWLSIPYVKNVSEATARILKPFGIGVAHKPECTIRQQIMKPKDPLPTTEQSAVVYSIPCLNCNATYVGETGKRLGTRLHEHQLAINRKDKLSLVYGHIRELNHDFAFDKARTQCTDYPTSALTPRRRDGVRTLPPSTISTPVISIKTLMTTAATTAITIPAIDRNAPGFPSTTTLTTTTPNPSDAGSVSTCPHYDHATAWPVTYEFITQGLPNQYLEHQHLSSHPPSLSTLTYSTTAEFTAPANLAHQPNQLPITQFAHHRNRLGRS
ncbi:hypothetical protein SprV_0802472000 [Sparganum proliferum]